MKKRFWLIKPINVVLIIITLLTTAVTFFLNRTVFFVIAPISLICVGYCIYKFIHIGFDTYKTVSSMSRAIIDSHEDSMINFSLPSMIVSAQNEILWYNEKFREKIVLDKSDLFGKSIQAVFGKDIYEISANQGVIISYGESYYEVFSIKASGDRTKQLYMVYLVDITVLEKNMRASIEHRPVVMMIIIDNFDEAIGNENSGADSRFIGNVRNCIQDCVDETTGFIKRLERDRYIMLVENCHLQAMIANRFDVLDKVRELAENGRQPVTLSIGIAVADSTLERAETEARQALDMALGRGGDQAVIKTENGYEFFGGYSKGVEKRTKVKARIVSNAISELVKSADNVFIMGHKYADLDCLGSAIGMAKAVQSFGKRVNIVLDTRKNLAGCLVERMDENEQQNLIISPDAAVDAMTNGTLLIVVDTHSQMLIESPAVYKKANQVVVIDHHRKVVNHIDNAVIFYHEPYASSASEMVTELVQYFGENCRLTHFEAEALLAGIMLDTRNFIVRTGVRTFEAAAYLRRIGADTIEVRKLFASTMESYQQKTRIVAAAEVYNRCAIGICDFYSEDLRIIAPQAADELLGISGVKASFVIYEQDGAVNISARSMGEINVQIVMEKMGGGGHHTMAGTQIPNTNYDKVRQSLLEIIDEVSTS